MVSLPRFSDAVLTSRRSTSLGQSEFVISAIWFSRDTIRARSDLPQLNFNAHVTKLFFVVISKFPQVSKYLRGLQVLDYKNKLIDQTKHYQGSMTQGTINPHRKNKRFNNLTILYLACYWLPGYVTTIVTKERERA